MAGSQQREWVTGVLESLPSVTFLALWRGEVTGLEAAGWIGSAVAAAVLLLLQARRTPCDPILLGINLHLLAITPLIVGLFQLGQVGLARVLVDTAHNGVLIAVLVVGGTLTVFGPRGFIGLDGLPAALTRSYSGLLLAVAAAGVLWSFVNVGGSTLMSVGLPLMVLFGLRRYLVARWRDRAGGGGEVLAVAGAPAGDGD